MKLVRESDLVVVATNLTRGRLSNAVNASFAFRAENQMSLSPTGIGG